MTTASFLPPWWSAIILIYGIFLLWSSQHKKAMSEDGKRSYIGHIIGIGLIIATILSYNNIQNWLATVTGAAVSGMLLTVVTTVLVVLGTFSVMFAQWALYTWLGRRYDVKEFTVNIDHTKVKQGETLIFESTLTTKHVRAAYLESGFIKLVILDPYCRRLTNYDYLTPRLPGAPAAERKEEGHLIGRYYNRKLKTVYMVPNNAEPGKYRAYVKLCDKRDHAFIPGRKAIHTLKTASLEFEVLAGESQKLQVLKIAKSDIRKLQPLETNMPAKGWVCVKVRNPTATGYQDCSGKILCGENEYSLYDYREYMKNERNGNASDLDLYNIFNISEKSNKLLYADIETSSNAVKVQLDIGVETVEQEMTIA